MRHLTRRPHRARRLTSLLVVIAATLSLAALPGVAGAAVAGAPTAYDDFDTSYGGPTILTMTAFDDELDALTFQVASGPSGGSLGTVQPADCSAGYCTAQVTYTPSAGTTSDSFTFTATDTGEHVSDPATFSVTVDPGTPTAQDGTAQVNDTGSTPITIYASDPNGDTLTFAIASAPAHGTLGAIGAPSCAAGDCSAVVSYTPDPGATDDAFTFTVKDPGNHVSDPGSVAVTVTDLTRPVATDNFVQVGHDATTTVDLSGEDPADHDLTFAIVDPPAHGSLGTVATPDCSGAGCRTTVDYMTTGYTGSDSFTFTVSNGTKTSASATISLDVGDPPCQGRTITNGVVKLGVNCIGDLNVDQDGLKLVATGNDSTSAGCPCEGWGVADDTGDAATSVSGWANRSSGDSDNLTQVSFDHTASTAVSVVDVGSTFRITHDYHPSAASPNAYEVTVTVKNTSTKTTHLRYRRVMDWDIAPTEFSEYVTLQKGTSPNVVFTSDDGFASSSPLAGPSDLGNTGSFVDKGPDDHGALFDFDFGRLAAGASYSFKTYYGGAPDEVGALNALNAVGAEAYSLGQPSTENGPTLGTPNTFFFAFGGVGGAPLLAPTAVDDSVNAVSGAATPIDVRANDTDPNGDALSVTGHGDPAHGTVSCTSTGCTYTSTAGYTGPDSFTYTISDGHGGTASATVRVTVTPAATNHAPDAVADTTSTDEDTAKVVPVLGNDTDQDAGDVLAVTTPSPSASHGTVSCSASSCTYTPAANYHGPDSFTYGISDGHGGTDTATVSITVASVNDAPVAVADSASTPQGTAKAIAVTANDTDVDGDTLVAQKVTDPAHGTVTCAAGSCTYTPAAGYSGPDSFTYRVSDGTATSAAATVTMTVTKTAPAPCKPAAPAIGTASGGAKRGLVTAIARWSAPTATCAYPVTKYVVTAYKVNKRGKVVLTRTFTAPASARQLEVKLPGRRSWVFTVTAVNSVGSSAPSAKSNKVVAQ